MTEEIHFLSAKTLSKETTRSSHNEAVIKRVMKHNLREIQSEFGERAGSKIDPQRIRLNEILYGLGTADDVAGAAHHTMDAKGVTPRANAALGIEILVCLPMGLTFDYRAYFMDAIKWANEYFAVPMLSAIIHNDEEYPHMHIVMLPIVDGKLDGSKLMGDRTMIKSMQVAFHERVGKVYGLCLPTPQKRHSAAVRLAAAQIAIDALHDNGELCATTDAIVGEIRALIAANPEKLLSLMGRTMPAPTVIKGDFVKMMTKPCKPEKPNRTFGKSLIGHLDRVEFDSFEREKAMSYALLGHSDSPSSFPPPNEAQPGRIDATLIAIEKLTAGEHEPAPILDDTTASNQFISLPFAARIEPSHNPIDSRQRDLFDQPASESSDSDQPANNPQHHEYRVSEQRLEPVRTLLTDKLRCHSSDREIGRETGVSASIVRDMRAELMPDASQYRTFQRGGKTIVMNVSNIGKRPAAQPSQIQG